MPSEYVQPTEYPYYGLPDGTTAQQVRAASTLIDNYLDRQEGLVWMPDSFGRPAYMAGLCQPPGLSTLGLPCLAAAIAPGRSVVITYAFASYDLIGEVFILDRADQTLCEAVTVSGVDTVNQTITLAMVQRAHAAGAVLEAGLVVMEERQMPAKRSLTRVARSNLVGLLSVVGRYGYGRRSDAMGGYRQELNLIASLQTLGGFDTWQPVDASTCSISPVTGEVWVVPGLALDYFNEVRLRFVAGFSAGMIPPAIKAAVAQLVINKAADADNGTNPMFQIMQAGGTKIQRFGSSLFDDETVSALSTYKLRVFV